MAGPETLRKAAALATIGLVIAVSAWLRPAPAPVGSAYVHGETHRSATKRPQVPRPAAAAIRQPASTPVPAGARRATVRTAHVGRLAHLPSRRLTVVGPLPSLTAQAGDPGPGPSTEPSPAAGRSADLPGARIAEAHSIASTATRRADGRQAAADVAAGPVSRAFATAGRRTRSAFRTAGRGIGAAFVFQ